MPEKPAPENGPAYKCSQPAAARAEYLANARAAGVSTDPRHARARPRRSGRADEGWERAALILLVNEGIKNG
jgi:hypothetical protein